MGNGESKLRRASLTAATTAVDKEDTLDELGQCVIHVNTMQPNVTLARYGDVLIILKDYSNSKKFKLESRLLARFDSPFIVKPIGIITKERKLAIELMGNGDLRTYLDTYLEKSQPINWQTRAYIAWCVAKAVAYLHELGIEHQSLTSKHVLLSENMDVKVCSLQNAAISSTKEKAFGAADVFALGLIFQQLIHVGTTDYQASHLQQYLTWLDGLAQQCLDSNAEARPSAAAIVKILELHGASKGLLYSGQHHQLPLSIFKFEPTRPEKPTTERCMVYSRLIKLQKLVPQAVPIDQVPQLDKDKLQSEGTHVASSEFVSQFRGSYEGKPVIIHKMHKHAGEKEYEQLVLHIQVRARLHSKFIHDLLGLCELDNKPCMVLDGYYASTLRDLLVQTPPYMGEFLWRYKLQCARDIMAGVQYLHRQNVLCYNLSSMSVLVNQTTSYSIKLTDFGYSKLAKANETLTLGTGGCRWMAPEVIRHNSMESIYSDVFAFGVLLSELETHQVPYFEFKHDTIAQRQIANGCLPSFTSSCPTWYIQLAHDCMQFDPLKRPTPASIIATIESHFGGTGFHIPTAEVRLNQLDAAQLEFGPLLGVGHLSRAFKGSYNNQPVVIKRPNARDGYRDDNYFFDEITMLSWLKSPYIMQLVGVLNVTSTTPSMVLENMDFGDLTIYIDGIADPSTFYIDTKLHIALGIAQALEYFHEHNCVHCDVRSDNVYLNSKLQVKLSMLALARRLTSDDGVEAFPLPGTSVWMAPEVVNGGKYTASCDVYSFGVLLTMLHTLKRPFYAITMKNDAEDRQPFDLGVDCPPWYRDLTQDCIAMDAHKRPKMTEIVLRLQQQVAAMRDCFFPNIAGVTMKAEEMLNVAELCASVPKAPSEQVTISNVVLGSGGFGTVSRGTFQSQTVAIKQLHSATLRTRSQALKFVREVEIMASIRSPFIVECFGISDIPMAGPVLLLEYMDKGNLRRYLESITSLPWSTRFSMALALIQAIALLHEMNIVHRDIKSLNVLLNERFELKLADFGDAHYMSEVVYEDVMEEVGTIPWMAPELFNGDTRDLSKTDIYSFGVILSELDTLQKPYVDNAHLNFHAIRLRVARGELQPALSAHAPSWYQELAQSCLSFDPNKRPTASSIVERMRNRMSSPIQ